MDSLTLLRLRLNSASSRAKQMLEHYMKQEKFTVFTDTLIQGLALGLALWTLV